MNASPIDLIDVSSARPPVRLRRKFPSFSRGLVVVATLVIVTGVRIYPVFADKESTKVEASAKKKESASPPAAAVKTLEPSTSVPAAQAEKEDPAVEKPADAKSTDGDSKASDADDDKPADDKLPEKKLPIAETQAEWLDALAAGYTEASRTQKPIIVLAGSTTCIYCRRLAEEIKTQVVQDELRSFTLVEIDVDKSPGDAALLRVVGIPALRVLTPHGKPVTGRDGMVPALELAKWLKEKHETAASIPTDDLADTKKPDKTAVTRIVKAFQQQDAAIREAAIRRLLPYPDVASRAVVDAYSKGGLSSKLCAIELLSEWKAPVDGLDPWQPETLTEPRITALNKWVATAQPLPPPSQNQTDLKEADIAAIRDAIAKMKSASPAEAQAIRERLARLGPALLSEVRTQLKQADTDLERERLTALRYRLVVRDKLVFEWPGGLERLSATEVPTREKAADELAARATSADEALLLELFSDPAPLVREISLRTLTKVGGVSANSALIKLLDDPEPNVRAAVLGQLNETSAQSIVPQISEYVAREKDADLVVHAVRLLRKAKGKPALTTLLKLLEHESWRVRAEACEAVAEMTSNRSGGGVPATPEVHAALIRRLEDEDGFVVSRAVRGLSDADVVASVEPMVKAIANHPELGAEIVTSLAQGSNRRSKAVPHLRKLAGHERPAVRAAAVAGLCTVLGDGAKTELNAALKDSDVEVRIAAANSLYTMIEQRQNPRNWPQSGVEEQAAARIETTFVHRSDPEPLPLKGEIIEAPTPGNVVGRVLESLFSRPEPTVIPRKVEKGAPKPASEAKKAASKVPAPAAATKSSKSAPKKSTAAPKLEDRPVEAPRPPGAAESGPDRFEKQQHARIDSQLQAIRTGKAFPSWMHQTVVPLKPMLSGQSPEERLSAAVVLAALGQDKLAIPVLHETFESKPALLQQTSRAVGWLTWPERVKLLEKLLAHARSAAEISMVAGAVANTGDTRSAEILWGILARESLDVQITEAVLQSLQQLYFPNHYYQMESAPPAQKKRAVRFAHAQGTAGTRRQRLAALVMLLRLDADTSIKAARAAVDDPSADPRFRADALQIMLLAMTDREAGPVAIEALASDNPRVKEVALTWLSLGDEGLTRLLSGPMYLRGRNAVVAAGGNSDPIKPPAGVKAEDVRSLLKSDDAKVVALAHYLLCLMGEKDSLAPLLAYWEQNAQDDPSVTRLAYRALAHANDASHVGMLEDIYLGMKKKPNNNAAIRDFYWSIRNMNGPEILALRKRIRDEVGMDNLR